MLQLNLSTRTEQRLTKILSLHKNKNIFFNKVIDYQINELNRGILNIEKDLTIFEKKYKITTEQFYKKFKNGKIDDEDDFMIWAGIYEMYMRDKQKLEKIKW